ncbi:Hypothetical predicted protein [Olea europaea subsp. europaea]|uniref:Uncharacterized protein n=1 Tax=Olea europaea subsp. europaea TaxID=158383 RepID=A0A8S0TC94_OLEEU|nr:Hypothetical predicted protein [Olea europaea subsp. europaea]
MIDSKAPMPWIGLYAAVASLIWTVALSTATVHSVRHRKLWFPCRYSALNAASLTVLAIAVKLSMDLTTPMPGMFDQAAKSVSTAFLCASTTHFMPSLGSMSDRDIIVNLTALGILIVTLTVNVIIQVSTGVIEDNFQVVVVFLNVYAFIVLSSAALTVFTSKRYLERKYKELQTRISAAELQGDQIMDFDKLKLCVKKYWVMTETDIFAACLTNLPRAILEKCNNSAINEREKIIKEVACLLGETQDVLKALQKREIPNLSPNQSICIDEWRTLLKYTNHGVSDSTPSSENIITASSGEVHLDIQELRASATTGALETNEGNAESHVSGEVEESGEEKENHQA